ncbi:site-specific DNA-methyltransferase [Fusobacterium necrophorum subsp. funduliforme]|uniref:DNA-methyltransferase n=1 Tax=Fusobacterium necrophorum TaxID=859 RepID=UPI000D119941|nr:site-specific DNA-methyltransferase [Fusobacterium necrophorum]AVQ21392.1 site-specific DNA-methyltransferase [Fusobacterium necrophorum subsp. funduliforme]MBR8723212.1 Modification methylase RsrI [Fusobacterium necrophorum subsp. funduliforme]MCF0161420.1 site-specific DNA-methyltransferase [Fusobacterium necrophorum]MCI7342515.1 site-specific DNA-methyltransferase [Fusobacterium necrophorum]
MKIIHGDVREKLCEIKDDSVDCIVTSPPYWRLRDYKNQKQLGLEETPEEFIQNLCNVFDECYRVLKDTGTLFVNLGDSYSNSNSISTVGRRGFYKDVKDMTLKKTKCMARKKSLVGIPAMFMLEMIKRGWILRNKIIWQKTNAMPESVRDRFTNDYEEVFFFTKKEKYFFNKLYEPYAEKTLKAFKDGKIPNSHKYLESGKSKCGMREGKEWLNIVSEKGRNMRTVWSIGTTGIKEAHFSTFPLEIARRCILAGCPIGGTVLDIFLGSGTTLLAAKELNMHGIGIELVAESVKIAEKRLLNTQYKLKLNGE